MTDRSELVTGGCLCGAVRHEARAYLKHAYYCHRRICQKTSAAPADIPVLVEPGTLKFTKGEPKQYQTSPFGERGFCPTCESRFMWRVIGDSESEYTNLSVGSVDRSEKKAGANLAPVRGKPAPLGHLQQWPAAPEGRGLPEFIAAWAAA